MKSKGFSKVALGVFAALTLIGVGCWVFQLANGLGVTGMSNVNSWGAYICTFMLFVGLSAGGLIVASSAHVFGIESFKGVAKPAVICSIACICVAGMFVLVDMGGIQRVWRMFTGPNFISPLFWDMCIITAYLVINILDLVWMQKGDEEKVRKLSYVALPVAILVHSVTAWIFGLQIARAWYTAIMAPIFVASAMDSGLALLLLGLMLLDKVGLAKLDDGLLAKLGKLLATFICVDAFFIGCELLTMGYPGAHEAVALQEMAFGATAPFFWFELIGGLLVPFLVLASAKRREKRGMVALASVLVVLGVACKRVWLLFTSFIHPNVYGGAGITTGTSAAQTDPSAMWATTGSYTPTLPEVLIVIGVISVGVLAFIGNSLLSPMSQTEPLGIEPAFWDAFPAFGDDAVHAAVASCRDYAESAQESAREGSDPVQAASVEFTKLFVGPPRPAAAPWETFYRQGGNDAAVGFGQATFEMRELLRGAGLEVSNDNNQYADHMGIELLLLSVLVARAAEGEASPEEAAGFARSHPASWIVPFREKVSEAAPEGYFSRLVTLAEALLHLIAA